MQRRISGEQREIIRELQEEGLSDYKIAKMLDLPYYTVHYQRPEVRERRRKYMREYHRRPEVRERERRYNRKYRWRQRYPESFGEMDTELNEFINLTPNSRYTLLAGILRILSKSKSGLKHSQIYRTAKKSSEYKEKLGERKNIRWELNRLMEMGLISYKYNGRYVITDNGRELIKKLYEI